MTDTNVTELHPSPRKGEGPSPGALRQRRYRARRKRVTRNVTPVVTPPAPAKLVTPAVTPVTLAGIDLAAYAATVALAGAAAWFSVRGMTVLFPGAPLSVTVMAVAMEGSKLVTALACPSLAGDVVDLAADLGDARRRKPTSTGGSARSTSRSRRRPGAAGP
jgi:hypothetical protein